MRFVIAVYILLAMQVYANAEVAFNKGTLEVRKTSGKQCKEGDIGGIRQVELVLEQGKEGCGGYFRGNDMSVGKIIGVDPADLSVIYPFFDKSLAEGHKLTLSVQGDFISGALREKHLDPKVENCNFDEAFLTLRRTSTGEEARLAQEKLKNCFAADVALLEGDHYSSLNKYDESITFYEKSLSLKAAAEGKGIPDLLPYLKSLADALVKVRRFEEANKLQSFPVIKRKSSANRSNLHERDCLIKMSSICNLVSPFYVPVMHVEHDVTAP